MQQKTEMLIEKLRERIDAAPAKANQPTVEEIQKGLTLPSLVRLMVGLQRLFQPLGMDLVIVQSLVGPDGFDQLTDEQLTALLLAARIARTPQNKPN